MGISIMSETGDRADGFDPDTGTVSSRASQTGWVPGNSFGNGKFYYSFGVGDGGGEATSRDDASLTTYSNTAQSCERSIRTYIKEDLKRNIGDNTFNYRNDSDSFGTTSCITIGQYGAVS